MRLDGSEKMKYENMDNVRSFTLYDDWLYYLLINNSFEDRRLYRMRTDGSNNQLIAENCFQFVISDGYIFLTERISLNDTKIIRYNLDGTAREVLIENNARMLLPIFTENGYLYFTVTFGHPAYGVRGIHRIKFDGTEHQTIVHLSGVGSLGGFILNDGFIYYGYSTGVTDSSKSVFRIYKISADGTDNVKLLEYTPLDVSGFTIFGNYIYYRNVNTVYRLPKNGGTLERVYNPLVFSLDNNPRFVTGWFMSNNKIFIVEEPLQY